MCQKFLTLDNYLIFFVLQGLEGRSTNPVSVLFDALEHPDADLGVQQPSLLEWKLRKDLSVNHVVLGPGCPGGAWKVLTEYLYLLVLIKNKPGNLINWDYCLLLKFSFMFLFLNFFLALRLLGTVFYSGP